MIYNICLFVCDDCGKKEVEVISSTIYADMFCFPTEPDWGTVILNNEDKLVCSKCLMKYEEKDKRVLPRWY